MKHLFVRTTALALAVLAFSLLTAAQTGPQTFENVTIGNFGQMDENYYRGAQPEVGQYQSLAALGIKTVIDLRNDPTDYERVEVEKLGMKYVNIPMSGWKTPKDRDVEAFLKLASDPETGKFFVHCKAGIHRTGMTGAVYRFTKYGWDYDKAYKEMKNYNFFSGLWHGSLKSYVKRYAEKMVSVPREAAAQAQTTATSNQ